MNNEKMQKIINKAIFLAEKAAKMGEIPVAGVIFNPENGEIIAAKANATQRKNNATAHAEMLAIESATKKLKSRYLEGYAIFVTLEPCPMCATALSFAKISYIFFGARDEKGGGILNGVKVLQNQKNLFVPIVDYGFEEDKCAALLKDFFKKLRKNKNAKA